MPEALCSTLWTITVLKLDQIVKTMAYIFRNLRWHNYVVSFGFVVTSNIVNVLHTDFGIFAIIGQGLMNKEWPRFPETRDETITFLDFPVGLHHLFCETWVVQVARRLSLSTLCRMSNIIVQNLVTFWILNETCIFQSASIELTYIHSTLPFLMFRFDE